jgi:hypothetical protein
MCFHGRISLRVEKHWGHASREVHESDDDGKNAGTLSARRDGLAKPHPVESAKMPFNLSFVTPMSSFFVSACGSFCHSPTRAFFEKGFAVNIVDQV